MSASHRVLWVTDEPPDRSLGGGNIRQANLFEALATAHPTDLLVAGRVTDERVRAAAADVIELAVRPPAMIDSPVARRPMALGLTLGSRYPLRLYAASPARRALAARLRSLTTSYDLVCVEHESLAPLAPTSRRTPWAITFHHVLSGMMAREIELVHGRRQRWLHRRDLGKAYRLERQALATFDRSLVCSEADAEWLGGLTGSVTGRVAVVPNGVDLELFRPRPLPVTPQVLLPGTLDWGPNVDAARWFATDIWPRIRTAVPDAQLVLAGRSPVAAVRALAELPNVSVHANVPAMAPYFERARTVVVPLRVGTGTRLKALEAMAATRPVVGTTVGLDGIGVTDGVDAVVADSAEELADAVIRTLRDDKHADALARAGRAHAEAHFGWRQIGAGFVRLMDELIERGRDQEDARVSSRVA